MKSTFFKYNLIASLILLLFIDANAQKLKWFECRYFNQATNIEFLYNPYLKMESAQHKSRLLISEDIHGITIYNSQGPSYLYKQKLVNYNLQNGKIIKLYEGINENRQYYLMGISAPIGLKRYIFDSSIIIATDTKANHYGVNLLFDVNTSDQFIDEKLSVSVDSVLILIKTDNSNLLANSKRILLKHGRYLEIDKNNFDLQIIKGNKNVRHYMITNSGTELYIKENINLFTFSISTPDGGLVRLYTSRK